MRPKRKTSTNNRKTRHEPPTLEEAIFAAQGLSEDPDEQAVIAATLMGLKEADVRPHVRAFTAAPRRPSRPPAVRRTVIVERRGPRATRI